MKQLLVLVSILFMLSCDKKKDKKEEAVVLEDNIEEKTQNTPKNFENEIRDEDILNGIYVGAFKAEVYDSKKKPSYSNRINITIDSIVENTIYGHSVVAGNSRPFLGELVNDGNNYRATLKEPGDNKYDGKFELEFVPDYGRIKGFWIANNPNLAVSRRSYDLKKTSFNYNPDQYIIDPNDVEEAEGYADVFAELYSSDYDEEEGPESEYATIDAVNINASNTELKKEDVENLYKGDLEIIRNTIYARHGYSFKNRKMRYFFDQHVGWYIPMYTDVRDNLTILELKNIELIKRYEEHADKYYDYFGR